MFIDKMRWIGVLSLFIFNYAFAKIDFKQDIEPLLQDYCIDCHGPKKQTSGFRLDRRAYMLKGGDTGLSALVPGDVENSYMIEVIKSDDPDLSEDKKFNFDVWYNPSNSIIIKVTYSKMGDWEYKLRNFE